MTEYAVRRPLKRAPSHPGKLMQEILRGPLHMSKAEAARRMRITRPALSAVLNGESAVSAAMALRFCRLAGGDPQLLLNMQAGFDLWYAKRRLAATLARIAPAGEAA
jgi:addiction module HigA family antidote